MGVLSSRLEKPFSLYQERNLMVLSFHAFGTACKVKFSPIDSINYEFISRKIVSWVSNFEIRYSRYIPDSWLSLINESAGVKPVKLLEEDQHILSAATFTYFQSNHAIDPSCLPLTFLWQQARNRNQLPQQSEIRTAKDLVNWEKVEISGNEIFFLNFAWVLILGASARNLQSIRCLKN